MKNNQLATKSALAHLVYRGMEVLCWVFGAVLICYVLLVKIQEARASNEGILAFEAAAQLAANATDKDIPSTTISLASDNEPLNLDQLQTIDQSLWSKKRISQYVDIQKNNKESPLAVLRIDDLKIVVPVYEGANDLNLNRGAGWVPETAPIDGRGNIGIAAHRDSFFRALKDAKLGQQITLHTMHGIRHFILDQIRIIDPSQVEVLEPSTKSQLTLITCYPFYHVGNAPQRFIVTAIEDNSARQSKE
jgi:sortase A